MASLGEESGYVPYICFATTRSFMDSRPEKLQAFTQALQKGLDYVKEHRAEEIASVISPQFEDVDVDTLTRIVLKYCKQDTGRENLIIEKESFGVLQNILKDSGVLKERVPYEEVVNTDFARRAAHAKH